MSATVTPVSSGNVTSGSAKPVAAATGGARPGAQRGRRSTPGALRLLLFGLVALAVGWGALAAVTVAQHASGATQVVSTSEPLSIKAEQIYS